MPAAAMKGQLQQKKGDKQVNKQQSVVSEGSNLPVLTNRAKQQAMEDNVTPIKGQKESPAEKRGLSQSPSQSIL